MTVFRLARAIIHLVMKDKAHLVAENLALRQQLAVAQMDVKRPKLRRRDKIFWVWLSRLWTKWRTALTIVQPETVIRWHRQGFRLYWARKSKRSKPSGRPKIDPEIRDLIGTMSRKNPTWSVRRIRDELALLAHSVSPATVWKYADRSGKPPSQTWRSLLVNHAHEVVAIDFFTVPTAKPG